MKKIVASSSLGIQTYFPALYAELKEHFFDVGGCFSAFGNTYLQCLNALLFNESVPESTYEALFSPVAMTAPVKGDPFVIASDHPQLFYRSEINRVSSHPITRGAVDNIKILPILTSVVQETPDYHKALQFMMSSKDNRISMINECIETSQPLETWLFKVSGVPLAETLSASHLPLVDQWSLLKALPSNSLCDSDKTALQQLELSVVDQSGFRDTFKRCIANGEKHELYQLMAAISKGQLTPLNKLKQNALISMCVEDMRVWEELVDLFTQDKPIEDSERGTYQTLPLQFKLPLCRIIKARIDRGLYPKDDFLRHCSFVSRCGYREYYSSRYCDVESETPSHRSVDILKLQYFESDKQRVSDRVGLSSSVHLSGQITLESPFSDLYLACSPSQKLSLLSVFQWSNLTMSPDFRDHVINDSVYLANRDVETLFLVVTNLQGSMGQGAACRPGLDRLYRALCEAMVHNVETLSEDTVVMVLNSMCNYLGDHHGFSQSLSTISGAGRKTLKQKLNVALAGFHGYGRRLLVDGLRDMGVLTSSSSAYITHSKLNY